jgi:hypothetical protein
MPLNVEQLLNEIAEILAKEKDLQVDGVSWVKRPRAGFHQLEFVAPIEIGGVNLSGLQARISCRSDLPEADVYAQLELYVPMLGAYAHVQRTEWRPNAPHTNSGNAPSHLRFRTLGTRWHEFGVNRRLGLAGLRQTTTTIAQPFSKDAENFHDLLVFLEEVWRVRGISRIPAPPWEGRFL